MAKIQQFIARDVPFALGLPDVPRGGFAKPLAEGLAAIGKGIETVQEQKRKEEEERLKRLAKFDEEQRKMLAESDYSAGIAKSIQGIAAANLELQDITDPDEFLRTSNDRLGELRESILEDVKFPETRHSLGIFLEKKLAGESVKHQFRARGLRNQQISAQFEEANIEDFGVAVNGDTLEERKAAKTRAFTRFDLEARIGLKTPLQALKAKNKFIHDINELEFEQDINTDIGQVLTLNDKEFEERYPGLTVKERIKGLNKIKRAADREEEEVRKAESQRALLDLNNDVVDGFVNKQGIRAVAEEFGFTASEVRPIQNKHREIMRDIENDMGQIFDIQVPKGEEIDIETQVSIDLLRQTGGGGRGGELSESQIFKRKQQEKFLDAVREFRNEVEENGANPFEIWRDIADRHARGEATETPDIVDDVLRVEAKQPRLTLEGILEELENQLEEDLIDGFITGQEAKVRNEEIRRRRKELANHPEKPAEKPKEKIEGKAIQEK